MTHPSATQQLRWERIEQARALKGADGPPPVATTRYGREGQCGGCGAFRPDGYPPTVHRAGCVVGPDGSRLAPLRTIPPASRRPSTWH